MFVLVNLEEAAGLLNQASNQRSMRARVSTLSRANCQFIVAAITGQNRLWIGQEPPSSHIHLVEDEGNMNGLYIVSTMIGLKIFKALKPEVASLQGLAPH